MGAKGWGGTEDYWAYEPLVRRHFGGVFAYQVQQHRSKIQFQTWMTVGDDAVAVLRGIPGVYRVEMLGRECDGSCRRWFENNLDPDEMPEDTTCCGTGHILVDAFFR